MTRLLLFVAVAASTAMGQTPTGVPAVDSAAVARAAWARAGAALRTGDAAGARAEVAHSAAAWPEQPAYPWAEAVLAARAGDRTAALAALSRYASLGVGREPAGDTTFARWAAQPDFAAVFARLRADAAPLGHGRTVATLPDSTFWPEGVDYDPATGSYFVASVRHRTVAEVRRDGRVRELWPRDRPEFGAVLGVRADAARHVVWATLSGIPQMAGYAPADSGIGALVRVRIADGAIERRWDLPVAPGGRVLGDLAVGPRGDVFLTDSKEPVLYRLRPGADTLEALRHPLFHNLQGMAPTPDGRTLYVADYSHGLLRVDLETGAVTRVAAPTGATSLGCDGLVWDRGGIIAVQNGVTPARIVRFTLDAPGSAIARIEVLDREPGLAPAPTIGTIAGADYVYVANSLWDAFDDDGHPLPGARLTPPRLVAVPLRRAP